MKKICVGILGYGNLGRAVEEIVLNDDRFKLICIFSHRNIKAKQSFVDSVDNLSNYKNKIDILFLCGGSSSTLVKDAKVALKLFNIIDAFDTHKKINTYIKCCDVIAKQNSKIAFCSFGWDPGLFSLMRVLFNSLDKKVYTTWGKGVSQGHGEAVRKIPNVIDAIQYTIPNKRMILKIKNGKFVKGNIHRRLCYVVAKKIYQKEIKQKILNMPNYFVGYKTDVKFISEDEIKKHKKLYHGGEVFTLGNEFNFSLRTNSNPNLTAKIMVAYSLVEYDFRKKNMFGAYSILDISIGKLIKNSRCYL